MKPHLDRNGGGRHRLDGWATGVELVSRLFGGGCAAEAWVRRTVGTAVVRLGGGGEQTN